MESMKLAGESRDLLPDVPDEDDIRQWDPQVANRVEFRSVDQPDIWLQTAYRILRSSFGRDVLDPYEHYVEWMNWAKAGHHPFPFVLVVAYIRDADRARVVGVISGNIMEVRGRASSPRTTDRPQHIFAIGHQLTLGGLRQRGIKGVGTALWHKAIDECTARIHRDGGAFAYSFLEAEGDSLGFWSKLGYLWPQGVRYWQPPIEFDRNGDYIRPEVPEVLMLRPMECPDRATIGRDDLLDIVRTVYLNWSLYKYRTVLSAEAMKRAEDYVMGSLMGRILERMPQGDRLRLVPVHPSTTAVPQRTHFRTVALNQGPQHHLQPLRSLRLSAIADFDEMLQAMKDLAFGSHTLAEAADILYAMAIDPACKVVLTLSGPATIAQLDMIVAEMIGRGMVDCVVTTGDVVCHGFNEERGRSPLRMREGLSDLWLFEQGYNRVFDTLAPEDTLDELEHIIHTILEMLPAGLPLTSQDLVRRLGEYLYTRGHKEGFLAAAYSHGVPVFIPALTDGEIGLDVALFNHHCRIAGKPEVQADPFRDFEAYIEFMRHATTKGLITIGGGTPRSWSQQVSQYLDAIERNERGASDSVIPFKYAVRVCPDPHHLGGLSGSTISESISWGGFLSPEEGGRSAEILADFTLVFPLLVKAVFQRMEKNA